MFHHTVHYIYWSYSNIKISLWSKRLFVLLRWPFSCDMKNNEQKCPFFGFIANILSQYIVFKQIMHVSIIFWLRLLIFTAWFFCYLWLQLQFFLIFIGVLPVNLGDLFLLGIQTPSPGKKENKTSRTIRFLNEVSFKTQLLISFIFLLTAITAFFSYSSACNTLLSLSDFFLF